MNLKIMVFFIFLVVNIAFSAEDISCSPSKLNNNKIACEGKINGYIKGDEVVRGITISYNSSNKNETIYTDNETKYQELNNPLGIAKILSDKGIKNFKNAKNISFSIEKDTPIFKDPEGLTLAYGCRIVNSPVVISYPTTELCNEFLCSSTIECKNGDKIFKKDGICKAKQTNEGVFCPKAKDCLEDRYVKIENYNEPSSSRLYESDNTSGGISK